MQRIVLHWFYWFWLKKHLHLADAFIQSDLQCIQATRFFYQYVCSLGIEPTTFCTANAMLYHWATGTPMTILQYNYNFLNNLKYLIMNNLIDSSGI